MQGRFYHICRVDDAAKLRHNPQYEVQDCFKHLPEVEA